MPLEGGGRVVLRFRGGGEPRDVLGFQVLVECDGEALCLLCDQGACSGWCDRAKAEQVWHIAAKDSWTGLRHWALIVSHVRASLGRVGILAALARDGSVIGLLAVELVAIVICGGWWIVGRRLEMSARQHKREARGRTRWLDQGGSLEWLIVRGQGSSMEPTTHRGRLRAADLADHPANLR